MGGTAYSKYGNYHLEVLSGVADEAIEAYKAVKYSHAAGGGRNVELPDAAGDPIAGITTADVALGEMATFVARGITEGELGATLTPGTKVMADTDGQLIAATTTNHVVGVLLDGGDAGDIVAVKLEGADVVLD